jgi:Flp pilus assembly protein TadD
MSGVSPMNKQVVLKVAISAFALAATMAGCKSAADSSRVAFASDAAAPKKAAAANTHALAVFRAGDHAGALAFAEEAVTLAPHDAGYRATLADIYLRNGRFQSAEVAYRDTLTLNPGDRHAEFSLVLCEIANGRRAAAIATLDGLTDNVSPADLGLAYALAGQPQRAVALLEPAARDPGANPRLRQNLAFAYALSGDWQKARVTAAQDISPAELGARLAQWAALAQPSAPSDQVAALLGVRPSADPGLPERLALAPEAAPVALAGADPVPAAPAALASAAPAPADPPAQSPAPAASSAPPEPRPVPQVQPDPPSTAPQAPVRVASASSDLPAWMASIRQGTDAHRSFPAAPHALLLRRASIERSAGFGRPAPERPTGHFAVQLGAFHSASSLEHAWVGLTRRFAFADKTPLSTTIDIPGRGTFHRLSVAGFASHEEASRTCEAVRAKGGACFVRAVAGDTMPQWALRYIRGKTAIASR